ncbi:MAG: GTP cyclohydrolase I FolE [Gammaproteobacteria bacterium]|nr:GTP cyclohydrolase I FolE [Gammaproteobacteria bacterium]
MNRKALEMLAGGRYLEERSASQRGERDLELEVQVRKMLQLIGENPEREGLVDTPRRVSSALHYLTSGYELTVEDAVSDALFEESCEEMVIVKDVEFYSLCEHHILPFFGRAHIGYLPKGRVIGLSKIARVVDIFARRLQVQERLTNQIASGLLEVLNAHGVAVVLEASHFCMVMRGVQKQNSKTVTSSMLGAFRDDSRSRSEFMELIRQP